jgi:hypothetical protein
MSINLKVNGNRANIRKQTITAFLDEEPGTGKGELCSRYTYNVEKLESGEMVYLRRPAALNKGVDFEVHVEGIEFRARGARRTMPSHNNIVEDLIIKKNESSRKYAKVKKIINKLYECKRVTQAEYRNITFAEGHPIEAILKAIKWLFIEQDVIYWNWSGRNMLYSKLQEENLC